MTHAHRLKTTLRPSACPGCSTPSTPADQAQAGQLGRLEFLQVLCEDEITHHDATAVTRRIRQARFEQLATIEDFDFTSNPKTPAAHHP